MGAKKKEPGERGQPAHQALFWSISYNIGTMGHILEEVKTLLIEEEKNSFVRVIQARMPRRDGA
jgi:hypothetical protein